MMTEKVIRYLGKVNGAHFTKIYMLGTDPCITKIFFDYIPHRGYMSDGKEDREKDVWRTFVTTVLRYLGCVCDCGKKTSVSIGGLLMPQSQMLRAP